MEYADAHEIVKKLYLGNYKVATNLNLLKSLGITHILNASIEHPNYFEDEFIYKKFPLYDSPHENIRKYFNESFKFIDDALNDTSSSDKSILIHCHAGISRSSTLVIYYLMKKNNLDVESAFKYVKNIRHFIAPNHGFINQLSRTSMSS